ncbi:MAG: hypothetical protein WED04_10635 [Promethearchaeati archaeon SRVP18_Atabeyarchaeia-1]
MAEAVKQFFVGFIHPRTWLAAIIALVVAAVAGLALSGTLIDTLGALYGLGPAIIDGLKSVAFGTFLTILLVWDSLVAGSAIPLLMVIVSAVVAGLVFGLISKKERVASKSIIGGLNIAVIYLVIVVIVFLVWWIGFTGIGPLYSAVIGLLGAIPIDILVTFLVVWWVSAIVSMIVLSAKHA